MAATQVDIAAVAEWKVSIFDPDGGGPIWTLTFQDETEAMNFRAVVERPNRAAILAEREACAQMVDDWGAGPDDVDGLTPAAFDAKYGAYPSLTAAIRARV